MTKKHQTSQEPVVRGEYNRNGYAVWCGDRIVYSAGNHAQDSGQSATCEQNRLPLTTMRKFCLKTAREIAIENGGPFAGVELVTEDEPNDENQ
jgi:hypothetical protein